MYVYLSFTIVTSITININYCLYITYACVSIKKVEVVLTFIHVHVPLHSGQLI